MEPSKLYVYLCSYFMLIKEIKAEETWRLRRKVLWPNKTLEYVKLDEDKFGRHYGLFLDEKLTSVISISLREVKLNLENLQQRLVNRERDMGLVC